MSKEFYVPIISHVELSIKVCSSCLNELNNLLILMACTERWAYCLDTEKVLYFHQGNFTNPYLK